MEKLHLGCGTIMPDGWVNVDGSWNAWLAKHSGLRRIVKFLGLAPAGLFDIPWKPNIVIHDFTKTLPFENDTFDVTYASHLLEHLYFSDGQHLLRECYRVLKPGGILRMVVPDLRSEVLEYISDSTLAASQSGRADLLNERLHFYSPTPTSGGLFYKMYKATKNYDTHKWMYDADSLVMHFRSAGFLDATEHGFRESQIPGIQDVEQESRVLNGAGICVEGTKPIGKLE